MKLFRLHIRHQRQKNNQPIPSSVNWSIGSLPEPFRVKKSGIHNLSVHGQANQMIVGAGRVDFSLIDLADDSVLGVGSLPREVPLLEVGLSVDMDPVDLNFNLTLGQDLRVMVYAAGAIQLLYGQPWSATLTRLP